MSYPLWHRKVVKKAGIISEKQLYLRTFIFSLLIFALVYFYLTNQSARSPLNKAFADTSIILIGLSMLLSSLCYFWNFVDTKIIYRKHLGVIGFLYAVVHIFLSFSAVQTLVNPQTWQKGIPWNTFTGAIAIAIFSVMALISNRYAADVLGGIGWRNVLRTGYVAVALVWLHVFLLKSARILTWFQEGMKTTPSTAVLLLIFMGLVIVMRIFLSISLQRKGQTH